MDWEGQCYELISNRLNGRITLSNAPSERFKVNVQGLVVRVELM